MTIDYKGGHMTIDDNSPQAKKIKEGYDYEVVNGKIIIKTKPAEPKNKYQLQKKLKEASSVNDLKPIIDQLLNIIQ